MCPNGFGTSAIKTLRLLHLLWDRRSVLNLGRERAMEVRTIKTCSGLLTLRFQDGALLPQSDAVGLVVREPCEPSKTLHTEPFERMGARTWFLDRKVRTFP